MSEYNKIIYKLWLIIDGKYEYGGTFNSAYQALAYKEDYYPYVKYEIEAIESFD